MALVTGGCTRGGSCSSAPSGHSALRRLRGRAPRGPRQLYTPVDTEYYQCQVRGRGTRRRPHDLVRRFPLRAVRLQPDWSHRTRIDRQGLWIKLDRILGVTARSLPDSLEHADCRAEECVPCQIRDRGAVILVKQC